MIRLLTGAARHAAAAALRTLKPASDARTAEPACTQAPDTIEEYLDHGLARCIAFNRRGTLLAGASALCGGRDVAPAP